MIYSEFINKARVRESLKFFLVEAKSFGGLND